VLDGSQRRTNLAQCSISQFHQPYVASLAHFGATSQHAESAYDDTVSAELKRGFRVLRFWNDAVLKDLNGVCATIIAYVQDLNLQPWR